MKKQLYILLILVTTVPVAVRAQDAAKATPQETAKIHRWSVNVLGGSALPMGKFANMDQQSPLGGAVHTGYVLELSGAYHLDRHWGITLVTGYQQNRGNARIVYMPPNGIVPRAAEYLSASDPDWKMNRILAGGLYTLPLNPKQNASILIRAAAGIQKTHTADLWYESQEEYQYESGQKLPWAFSYQVDAGLQWRLLRRWSLLTYAGYNGSRPADAQKLHFPTGSLLLRGGIQFNL